MPFPALLLATALAAPAPHATNPWGMLAERDIMAMHDTIKANHPGPVDPQNPGFARWLEDGYAKAMAKAAEVNTFAGFQYAVRYYGAGFRDGHLNSGLMVYASDMSWPGFVMAYRGGKFVVAAVDDADDKTLPAVGSELVDCDGRAARTIVEEDVWPYAMGPMLDSAWPGVTPVMLADRGNPWVTRAKSCRFRSGDAVVTLPLRYRDTTVDAFSKRIASTRATLAPQPPARRVAGGVWVSIPSFADADADTLARLKELVRLAPEWRDAAFVIFDVRGNAGGNSNWGDQIVDGLSGKPYIDRVVRTKFTGQQVEWRVSDDNIAHVRRMVNEIRTRQGADAPSAKYFEEIANGMEEARTKNVSLYHRVAADDDDKPATGDASPLFRGKVVLLTDHACASACLDFADRIRFLPGSLHAGLTTFADSVYMETRGVSLPSGVGRLGLPVKVYRNRPRGHNEPWVPQQQYDGDINDTPAVQQWVLGLLTPDEMPAVRTLSWNDASHADVTFVRSTPDDDYLRQLRSEFHLDDVVRGTPDEYAKVLAVSRWVRSRWNHNGSNEPSKPDAITILHEAAAGKQFRCVEYATVLTAALQSLGIPARVIHLKTEDSETRRSGAGHVLSEAWLASKKKWILVDGQFDVIPRRGDTPLNAVELQQAIASHAADLTVDSLSGTDPAYYFQWVGPYLYYFGTDVDARYSGRADRRELILAPEGAREIEIFQGRWPVGKLVFTRSPRDFYAAPLL